MYRIRCLLLLALLVGCGSTSTERKWDDDVLHGPVGHTVASVAFSPDGKYLLVGYAVQRARTQHFKGDDKFLALWDIEAGKEVREFKGHTLMVRYVAFTPDGKYAVSASLDKTIRVWDVATATEIRKIGEGEYLGGPLALSTNGQWVVFQGQDWRLQFRDISEGILLKKFEPPAREICSLCFSPSDQLILSGRQAMIPASTQVWEVKSGTLKHTLDANATTSWPGTFSPDGKTILSERTLQGDPIKFAVILWDAETGKEVRTITTLSAKVWDGCFTEDGAKLFSGVGNGVISLIDINTGKELWYELYPADLIALSGDRKTAVTATAHTDYDKRDIIRGIRLDLWDVATGKKLRTLLPPKPTP